MQHARVRNRSLDVEFGQPLVEGDRRGETLDEFGDRLVEAARPRLPAVCLFRLRHVVCSHIIER